jgi:LmbE family N-acetylglucosaminyl deacetylase
VGELYKDLTPKTVFLPLAVGTHRDHRLTHQLWCTLPAEANIIFYEDRPYSFLPYNLALRLIEVGASIVEAARIEIPTTAADRHTALTSFAQGLKTVTMYKNVLTNKRQRFRYMLSAARMLKSPPAAKTLTVVAHTSGTSDPGDLSKIRAAVGSYKSQIAMLFDNMDTFARESASYNRALDGGALYCERYWHLMR